MFGFRHPQLSSSNLGSLTNGSTDNEVEDMEIEEASGHQNDVLQLILQKTCELGLELHLVVRTLLEKRTRTGSDYSGIKDFIKDFLNQYPVGNAAQKHDKNPLELQKVKECKVCIPCCHLVMPVYAEALDKCPICHRVIESWQMASIV